MRCHSTIYSPHSFETQGLGWPYRDTPTFVLTTRQLPRTRDAVEFHAGDLAQFVNQRLRPAFRSIWMVGGAAVAGECLRLGLVDGVRYTILPVLIVGVIAYKSGMVDLRYEVRGGRGQPRAAA